MDSWHCFVDFGQLVGHTFYAGLFANRAQLRQLALSDYALKVTGLAHLRVPVWRVL